MAATVVERLRAFPLFTKAADPTLRDVAASTQVRALTHGDSLWHPGDVPTHVYFLTRGLVEVVRSTKDGGEVGLALFGPRECPGLFASLDGKRFPAGARVLSEEAELMRTERAALLHAVDHDPAVTRAMSDLLRQHNAVLREKVDIVTAGEVPQRLATLFLVLGERFGDEAGSGELRVPITLSRRVIARLVGARVETVIRVLSRWEKESFVETDDDDGGFIVRAPARLRDEAHGA